MYIHLLSSNTLNFFFYLKQQNIPLYISNILKNFCILNSAPVEVEKYLLHDKQKTPDSSDVFSAFLASLYHANIITHLVMQNHAIFSITFFFIFNFQFFNTNIIMFSINCPCWIVFQEIQNMNTTFLYNLLCLLIIRIYF